MPAFISQNEVTMQCDHCNKTEVFQGQSIDEALNIALQAGWTRGQAEGEVLCPDCSKKTMDQ